MKLIVFLADGFEEVEALTVVDYLRRMEIQVDMVSIDGTLNQKGAHGIEVVADKLLSDIEDPLDYDGLVIPGGLPGATNLRDKPEVVDMVRKMDGKDGLLAAICAGPIVLEKAGVVDGRKLTSYPGFEDDLKNSEYLDQGLVLDANIITGRGPAYAVDFALAIVEYLLGEEKAASLEEDILYSEKTSLE